MFQRSRDWWWIFWSFVWGKVLRRPDYMPQEAMRCCFFQVGTNMSPRKKEARLLWLVWLWGYRLINDQEMHDLWQAGRIDSFPLPFKERFFYLKRR